MKKILFLVCFLMVCSPAAWGLEVQEAVMTTAVEDHAPVDDVAVFPAADGQLSCFTKMTGAVGRLAG